MTRLFPNLVRRWFPAVLLLGVLIVVAESVVLLQACAQAFAQDNGAPPSALPRPISSTPVGIVLILLVVFGVLGTVRALLPSSWQGGPWRWTRRPTWVGHKG